MRKIHELLRDPKSWTKHAFARNEHDEPVASCSPQACKWSVVGAMNFCYQDNPEMMDEVRDKLYAILNDRKCYDLLIVYNDRPGTTHDDILNLVVEADV